MKPVVARAVLVAAAMLVLATRDDAFAQSVGSPVTSSGQAAISGQPYVKTHKRVHKNFYGKHYNPFKHSKS